MNVLEDAGWRHGDVLEVYVHVDTGNGPGERVDEHIGPFERMDTGTDYFGRSNYDYWIDGVSIELVAGDYYFGFRNPKGDGTGTNYWLTSDGGRDGRDSGPTWFSLDAGETWEEDPSERFRNYAWQLGGVPEPSSACLIGAAALALFRRRR